MSYRDTPCLKVSFNITKKLEIEPKTVVNKASGSWCGFFSNYLAEKGVAGCFTLIVLWLSVFCVSSS